MQKKNIYIAGKVSGLPFDEATAKFEKFAREISEIHKSTNSQIEIVNPIKIIRDINEVRKENGLAPLNDIQDRNLILTYCIVALSDCEEIYLMPDWTESEGAKLEHHFAETTGMKIFYNLN